MEIKFNKKSKGNIKVVNLYSKDSGKKKDSSNDKYLNYKIPSNLNIRKFIIFVRDIIKIAKANKDERLSFDFAQFRDIKGQDLDEF